MYFRARARVRGLYYDSYASSSCGPGLPRGTTRNTRARGALVRAARAGRRAAVESSSRARPCGAWKTLVRRYDLPLALRKLYEPPAVQRTTSTNRSMPASHSALTSSPMAHKRHHPSGQSLRRGSAAPYPCARAHPRRCGRTPACPECPAQEWSRPAHRTCSTSSPAG